MATHAKARIVEETLAREFRNYTTGSAVIPDEQHGCVVVLYRTPDQPTSAFPDMREGVKVVVKITETRRKIR